MFTYVLYALAGGGLLVSFVKDRGKTKMALKKAWKSFENILPQFLAILIIIGLALSILSPETITMLMGTRSGVFGVLGAALIGSTLMMVGVVTLTLEIKTFGKRATLIRNVAAFVFSLLAALVIGVVL